MNKLKKYADNTKGEIRTALDKFIIEEETNGAVTVN
jgi:hypothetical protein